MANAPVKRDITIRKPGAFAFRIAVVNADNTPRNLTGYGAKMQIRVDADDVAAQLTLTNGSGLTIDTANGYVDIKITKTQTAAFTFTSGVWDLWIDNGGSDSPEYLAYGGVTVEKGVTQ